MRRKEFPLVAVGAYHETVTPYAQMVCSRTWEEVGVVQKIDRGKFYVPVNPAVFGRSSSRLEGFPMRDVHSKAYPDHLVILVDQRGYVMKHDLVHALDVFAAHLHVERMSDSIAGLFAAQRVECEEDHGYGRVEQIVRMESYGAPTGFIGGRRTVLRDLVETPSTEMRQRGMEHLLRRWHWAETSGSVSPIRNRSRDFGSLYFEIVFRLILDHIEARLVGGKHAAMECSYAAIEELVGEGILTVEPDF